MNLILFVVGAIVGLVVGLVITCAIVSNKDLKDFED